MNTVLYSYFVTLITQYSIEAKYFYYGELILKIKRKSHSYAPMVYMVSVELLFAMKHKK